MVHLTLRSEFNRAVLACRGQKGKEKEGRKRIARLNIRPCAADAEKEEEREEKGEKRGKPRPPERVLSPLRSIEEGVKP